MNKSQKEKTAREFLRELLIETEDYDAISRKKLKLALRKLNEQYE